MERAFSSGWSSVLAGGEDTIVAPATPPGRGALAIVRLTGSAAFAVAGGVCRGLAVEAERRAGLVTVVGPDGAEIDRGIAIPYRAPRSFTGEDMVELVVHGSPVVVRETVDALVAAGGRAAEPGEFTRRAVANGKLDLVQAEAVHDLVSADTVRQARAARRQHEGELSGRIEDLRSGLVRLAATLEAAIDFSEHGVDLDVAAARRAADEIGLRIARLADTAAMGRRLREGGSVVLVGAPNAGKSTLFNRLAGAERAIVSPSAGTTRDLVETWSEIEGVPIRLVDTAGLCDDGDAVEAEGVRRARRAAADAECVLLLWAIDAPDPPAEWWDDDRPGWIRVRSKADLTLTGDPENAGIEVSARTGAGLDRLQAAVAAAVGIGGDEGAPDVLVAERHRRHLEAARKLVESAPIEAPEIAAVDVRSAVTELESVLGRVDAEAVLDEVFRRFCIGK